jgi:amino acid adenylation domain-containing protein/non-ribosomal peptide synthase protein (TIGR01720 family)
MDIMTVEEKERILLDFNDTAAEYPCDKTIHQLFAEQVRQTPHRIALIGPRIQTALQFSITYDELNRQSNRLADLLKQKGVGADTLVAIMVERSIEMIIGILSILKSDGAYLPIDPDYPEERISYMLVDSGTNIVLTTPDLSEKSSITNCQLLMVNPPPQVYRSLDNSMKDTTSNLYLPRRYTPCTRLAYIIYTSGSTGNPKGIMVDHSSVVNLVFYQRDYFRIDEKDVILQFSSICFDASVEQVFIALTGGARLVLMNKETLLDMNKFGILLETRLITHLHAVPSFLRQLTKPIMKRAYCLKRVIAGGDVCSRDLAGQWLKHCDFYNEYGPTETTVTSIQLLIREIEENSPVLPIGRPVGNTVVYILDKYKYLQPIGIMGDLCIAGAGLARGYLNKPELTAEKFDHDLWDYRLYHTGDLARRLPDGNIEFLGRIDHQVKIRGFRIELEEIENRLLQHEQIKEVTVTAGETKGSDKYLCAYILSPGEPGVEEFRAFLSRQLPAYMIPSYFVELEKIPLNPSGKIDRKALPDPRQNALGRDSQYAPPGNTMEKILVEIWQNILGRKPIGIHDNFFLLGGDSIKAVQLASRLNNAGHKLEMRDTFQYTTIAQLAPRVKKIEKKANQSAITGVIPLTPIQEKFFARPSTYRHHYNQAVMLYFQERIREETVRVVFSKIQEHHDALRMSYTINQDRIVQTNHGLEYPLSLQVYDLRAHENPTAVIEEKAESIQAGIHLEKGPMMKLGLFHCRDRDYLLIVIHHLVIDGISWRILFEDIEILYHQYKNSAPLVLPPKTDSFKLWSEQQVQYSNSTLFLKEKSYWGALEQTPAPAIRTDFTGDNFCKDTGSLSFTLNEENTTTLLGKVNEAFGTEINDILLTALGLSINSIYGINRVLVALEGHGREKISKDIDITRTVGWFTTIYPVILDMSYKHDLSRQIKEIKEHLHQLPHRGIGYGILKYLTDQSYKEEIEFQSNPQICFNYLGQFDTDLKEDTFGIANQPSGNVRDPGDQREYQLEVSGMVSGHCLTMTIRYNETQYKKESIEEISGQFEKELDRIIAHCTYRGKKQLTPSDFDYKDLSFEELNEINQLFDKN